MSNPRCTQVVNTAKYSDHTEACRALPLDTAFKDSFKGGKRKKSTKRTKKIKLKGGSTGYFIDLESETMGGLARVKGYSVQPVYENGKVQESNEMCGGGKKHRSKKNRSRRHRSKKHRSKKHRSKTHRSKKHRSKKHRSKKHRSKTHRSKKHKNKKHKNKKHKNKKHRNNKVIMVNNNKNNNKSNNLRQKQELINNNEQKNKKLVNNVKGGSKEQMSVYTHNMNERQFGCRQPMWDAKCT